jgi:hypothetical protein
MRYPVPSGEDDKPNEEEKPETPKIEKRPPKVEWDLAANGQITARMYDTS